MVPHDYNSPVSAPLSAPCFTTIYLHQTHSCGIIIHDRGQLARPVHGCSVAGEEAPSLPPTRGVRSPFPGLPSTLPASLQESLSRRPQGDRSAPRGGRAQRHWRERPSIKPQRWQRCTVSLMSGMRNGMKLHGQNPTRQQQPAIKIGSVEQGSCARAFATSGGGTRGVGLRDGRPDGRTGKTEGRASDDRRGSTARSPAGAIIASVTKHDIGGRCSEYFGVWVQIQ